MKNKFVLTISILILTANAGFCTARSGLVHDLAIKFFLAMLGVIVSSIMIFLILFIYNKIRTNKKTNSTEEDILQSPKTIDDAIKFFINRNRLR